MSYETCHICVQDLFAGASVKEANLLADQLANELTEFLRGKTSFIGEIVWVNEVDPDINPWGYIGKFKLIKSTGGTK